MLAGLAGGGSAVAAPPETLTLAVHPYLPVKEVQSRFAPLADFLARSLGQPVTIRVGRDYEEHIETVGRDLVDLAFMGPAPYVKLVANFGRKPLLARLEVNGRPQLRGVIVTRGDSPVRALTDLKARRFAFGDPDSTMSHVVPQYMLLKAGVPPKELGHHQFLGAHKNVALAVLAGDFDAGAVKEEVYRELAPRGLRALATTPPVSEHLFVARATLPPERVAAVRRALLGLRDAPGGAAILDRLHKGATGLVPAADSDYDNLREILRALAAAGP